MDPGIYDFCVRETRALITGAVIGCEARWMSHPTNLWQAEHKPYQLVLAKEMGLHIPRTVITNDPTLILESFNTFGGMVVKAVRSGHLVSGGTDFAIYTSQVLKEHLTELQQAKLSPAIYQELITKKFDVRVTVVGDQIFVAHIDSQTDAAAAVDWRKTDNPALPHYRAVLPDAIKERVFRMVAKCGLTFAAIDFVLTPSNDYVFLELNPSGQWLWLDDQLELGISDAVARWLSQAACH
jgi:glutathione synthase/RimK-type ligase-like ATP-grasp enzyme